MKMILVALALVAGTMGTYAQTVEELKAEMAPKKDSVAAIQSRIKTIQKKIDAMPGWKIGAFGTIGGTISEFNNW